MSTVIHPGCTRRTEQFWKSRKRTRPHCFPVQLHKLPVTTTEPVPVLSRYDLGLFRVATVLPLVSPLIPFGVLRDNWPSPVKLHERPAAVSTGFPAAKGDGTCSTCHARRALSITREEHVSRKLDCSLSGCSAAWNLRRCSCTRYGRRRRSRAVERSTVECLDVG